MSYRGSKFSEQTRFLEKRSLTGLPVYSGVHNRGRGGKYRSYKRKMEKRFQAGEARRRAIIDCALDEAAALEAEAASYLPWCPEAADELLEKAKDRRRLAEEMLHPELRIERFNRWYDSMFSKGDSSTSESAGSTSMAGRAGSARASSVGASRSEWMRQREKERDKAEYVWAVATGKSRGSKSRSTM